MIGGRRRLVAQASAVRPPVIFNDARGLTALAALPAEFDRQAASAAWAEAEIPEEAHEGLWSAFEAAGLFDDASTNGSSWWEEWGWREARAYHEATRDYPFLQMDVAEAFRADAARMERYTREDPPPSVYQHLGNGTAVDLPRERGASDLERLGTLLDACFAERGRVRIAGGSSCLLKSIPSGGARHPTEVFVAAFDLPGLPAGIYHYDVEHHRLEEISPGQYDRDFADATLDLFSKVDTPPRAALVFTSLVERAMWRYRDPRSFRAILVDVGHAVSAYRRVARLLGYRTYAYQKMDDEKVASLLGVDRFRQPPLYVGTLVS